MSDSPTVNVEVALPPDSGPLTTEASNPFPVMVVNPTAPSGDAYMADLLGRLGALEESNAQLRTQLAAVEAIAIQASVTPEPEPTPDPVTETETEELVVPDSSDAGPREVKEKPVKQKPGWHRWI